ncbi:hypothetical protein EB796_005135 [Bugula neritina]|uniref:BBS10 n=1 Tax=Bugula neritina TaxID=10212 RepID=A0A7J7KE37_BUGNE|nr:hypothetical protein EB796_005135 [Bugula neritina]
MLSCTIDSISENYDNVEFEIPNVKSDNFQSVIESKSKQTIGFFRKLQHLDVSLIISTLKFSDLEKSVCSKFGISVIHTVPEEEAHFLSFALSLDILTHTSDDICFGLLEKCEQVTFGSQSYVHLVPRVSRFHSTFILGGVTEGICHQVSNLLVNCLKVIQSALSPGVSASNLSNSASKSLKSQGTSKDYRRLFSRNTDTSALASSAPKVCNLMEL